MAVKNIKINNTYIETPLLHNVLIASHVDQLVICEYSDMIEAVTSEVDKGRQNQEASIILHLTALSIISCRDPYCT